MAVPSPILSGAQAVVYVNATVYGRCLGVSWDVSQPAVARHGIDTLEPLELVRGPLEVSGSLVVYRLHRDGGAEGARLVAIWKDLVRGKFFSMQIRDLVSDSVVLRVDKAEVTRQSWSVRPRDLTVGTIGFQGLTYANEVEPAAG